MSSSLLAAVVVETLIASGVTDLVASPGSRNAALLLAAHQAEQRGRVRLHVRVDERVAGFLALGLAKASERPVAVITTSGTAVANLAPAAMEARAAGVPLLALTADRPAFLVGTGANQTGDQAGAFGPAGLAVVRLSSASGDEAAWSAAVQRALASAAGLRTRQPGPVQLNLEFAPPLADAIPEVAVRVARIDGARPGRVVELDGRPATVVLAGDATPGAGAEARALAEVGGFPLLAEPSSNARAGDHAIASYRRLLAGDLGRRIERVICVGHPTLSRPVSALLARGDVELIVVSDQARWHDPGLNAAVVADRVLTEPGDPEWLAQWRVADARVRDEEVVSRTWGGPLVAARVLASIGPDENLVLGSSNAIRDADQAPIPARAFPVYANRGLAGIDGVVSTAAGIALASGRRTTVLLGDLTAQHDLGALVRPPLERRPDLRVVVSHDDGGSIFSSLEQGAPEFGHAFERVFGTPQGLDLAAVASSLGWDAVEVRDVEALDRELGAGREFIVARIPRERR
ncbi:MAG TPA: 2-succinyl-5-enolpyruvyl-6-hydroxy-3-cyclohexene-1-carboxylic-acid synthase [Arachnia sp.]|nr:2-succinyl-5-enolpyruvyl-6-hydroxy-3-cyclohexene-1-carboxylic-acid synthase [Arachnia sp.]HMT85857.1 2-succinyl-5-enolpyruvyl-6-hydroxy-3-cyclohexene-1-carboxylic-acid synthase [Arachnia sp.]